MPEGPSPRRSPASTGDIAQREHIWGTSAAARLWWASVPNLGCCDRVAVQRLRSVPARRRTVASAALRSFKHLEDPTNADPTDASRLKRSCPRLHAKSSSLLAGGVCGPRAGVEIVGTSGDGTLLQSHEVRAGPFAVASHTCTRAFRKSVEIMLLRLFSVDSRKSRLRPVVNFLCELSGRRKADHAKAIALQLPFVLVDDCLDVLKVFRLKRPGLGRKKEQAHIV
jgi:hypothetical protein